MKQRTCCFTGHRSQSLPFRSDETDERCVELRSKLKAEIERLITEDNVTHFISGMALGVDQICAELVLELKKQYPRITLECAIPCEEQAVTWSEPQRDRYFGIVERFAYNVCISHELVDVFFRDSFVVCFKLDVRRNFFQVLDES